MRPIGSTVGVMLLLAAGTSAAEEKDPVTAPVEHERRGSFTFGLAPGAITGSAMGYPNDALKIDRAEFRTDTGASGGGAGSGWVGVAFTDWLTFALSGNGGAMVSADHRTTFGGFAFHVDAFPAYALGRGWRDAGVMLQAGISISNTVANTSGEDAIESGGASHLALGFFWEGIRLGKVAMGPFAAADMLWSPSALRPAAWLGWRASFYLRP